MRKFLICFFVFLILCTNCFNVFADGITIEQVISSRPDISVYGDFDFADLSQISASATIGEEKLDFTDARQVSADEGILYMFLVDCSTSISGSQMSAIKKALKEFTNNSKTPNDMVSVISFGLQTDVLCENSSDNAEIISAIDTLRNNQDGTVLFDAIDKAVEISGIGDTALPRRKVAIIISDADDFNVGGHTVDEIIDLASTSSLPFYSIGLNTGSKTGLDTFGQISRASGAKIAVSSAGGIGTELAKLVEDIKDCDVINFSADGNVISGKQQLFSLNIFSGGKTYSASRTISDLQWSADFEAPFVTGYEQLSSNIIKLTFSEDVLNADITSSYTISKSGKNIPLLSASYDKPTHSAILTFAKTPVSGKYTIKFFAITDNSMEKNAIADELYTAKIKGRNIVLAGIIALFTDFWWLLLIIAIVAACIICYYILKKRNGLMFVDGKFSFGENVKIKVKKNTPETNHKVLLDVKDSMGTVTQLDLSITSSLIFGRSGMCDITFEDAKLSRQHFVIETKDGIFILQNLSQTNGTMLNGIRINQPRKLQPGDKIFAGQTEFSILNLQW